MSWEKAIVYIPGKSTTASTATVEVSKPLPVVIYLHGCTGITSHNDIPWARIIKDLGYVVVQPDSLARRDRGDSCSGASRQHFNPGVHRLRIQEAEYALKKLQSTKWADPNNIFLMGHSEGAIAAARAQITGFRGVIISSWLCTDTYPSFNGLFTPRNTPVLTMGWDHDPWYYGTRWNGSCADKFDGRTNAENITFSGVEHSTAQMPAARDAVEKFLRRNLQK